MNPTLLSLSFLLFALTIDVHVPLVFSGEPEQVLDSNGKPISSTVDKYSIEPDLIDPKGGGVFWGGLTCLLPVLTDYTDGIGGMSVIFTIPGTSSAIIGVGTPLDIAFEVQPFDCPQSKWVVVEDDFPRKWVGFGPFDSAPGKKTLNGTFNIQKNDSRYKLVFCPTVSVTASPGACFDIGKYDDVKGRRLVLNTDKDQFPWYVMFVNARGGNFTRS